MPASAKLLQAQASIGICAARTTTPATTASRGFLSISGMMIIGNAEKAIGIGPFVRAAQAKTAMMTSHNPTPKRPRALPQSQSASAMPHNTVAVTSVSPMRALSRIWTEHWNASPAHRPATRRSPIVSVDALKPAASAPASVASTPGSRTATSSSEPRSVAIEAISQGVKGGLLT